MPLRRLLTALLLACGLALTLLPTTASAADATYGRTWRSDGVLRHGCHTYRFHYRVKPAQVNEASGDDWSAEFFLSDRQGRGLGTVAMDSGIDPRRGQGHYTLCSQSTVPGRFTIRGKLSVYEGGDLVDAVRIAAGQFRLRRA